MRIMGLLCARMRAAGRTSDKAAVDSTARRVVGMISDPRDASLLQYHLSVAPTQASEAGIDLKPLLKEAGLREPQIENRDARLEVRHQIRFLNLVASTLRDELLGFHLAQAVDLRELGWLYYVAASSETLGEALKRAAAQAA